jgi:FtsP/CotA-like multicopper oxidase with cupredoxin domain
MTEQASINGLTWPFTERLTYNEGEEVNWKVINASNQQHPMHLHGFYYTVTSHGNLYKDSASDKENIHKSVTELLNPGETMSTALGTRKDQAIGYFIAIRSFILCQNRFCERFLRWRKWIQKICMHM